MAFSSASGYSVHFNDSTHSNDHGYRHYNDKNLFAVSKGNLSGDVVARIRPITAAAADKRSFLGRQLNATPGYVMYLSTNRDGRIDLGNPLQTIDTNAFAVNRLENKQRCLLEIASSNFIVKLRVSYDKGLDAETAERNRSSYTVSLLVCIRDPHKFISSFAPSLQHDVKISDVEKTLAEVALVTSGANPAYVKQDLIPLLNGRYGLYIIGLPRIFDYENAAVTARVRQEKEERDALRKSLRDMVIRSTQTCASVSDIYQQTLQAALAAGLPSDESRKLASDAATDVMGIQSRLVQHGEQKLKALAAPAHNNVHSNKSLPEHRGYNQNGYTLPAGKQFHRPENQSKFSHFGNDPYKK